MINNQICKFFNICSEDKKNICQSRMSTNESWKKEAFISITNNCNFSCPYCFQETRNNSGTVIFHDDNILDNIFNKIESEKYHRLDIRGGEITTLTKMQRNLLFRYLDSLSVSEISIGTGNIDFKVSDYSKYRIKYHIRNFSIPIPKWHDDTSKYVIVLYPYELEDIYNFIYHNQEYNFRVFYDLKTEFPTDKKLIKIFQKILELPNITYRCSFFLKKMNNLNFFKIYSHEYKKQLIKTSIDLTEYKIYSVI